MGWNGTGYRITQDDLAVLQRSSEWVRSLYEERMRFLQESRSNRGIAHPRLCWDDMPPVMFDRKRRLREGRAEVVAVVPNERDPLPAAMSESLWSALEGGRAVITARAAEEVAEYHRVQRPEREEQLIREMGPRSFGEIRRRSVSSGRLENSLLLGDHRPLVFRECTFASCVFRLCEFSHVVFDQCSFTKCHFLSCYFHDCTIIDCDWDESRWGDWWTDKITIRGLSSREEDAEEDEIRRRRQSINWQSVNRVENCAVEGGANSVRAVRGIGPAAFMPDRLVQHFVGLLGAAQDEFLEIRERHRQLIDNGTNADGEVLILDDKRKMHRERERIKEGARWKTGHKERTRDPVAALDHFRSIPHLEDARLEGFSFSR